MLESYIERYLWISKGIEPQNTEKFSAKVVSNLNLTRKQYKIIPNFHRQIHMNLPRDIGLLSNVAYKDDIIKLHIVLKYLQLKYFTREEFTKSVKYPFSQENLDVAYHLLKNYNKNQEIIDDQPARIQNILSEFNVAQSSSPLNIMYETDFTRIGIMCQHYMFNYKNGQGKGKRVKLISDEILAKLLTLEYYPGRSRRNHTLKSLRESIRQTAIFQPFSNKMKDTRTSIESISEEWGIPIDILNKVRSEFEDLVLHKCKPLKWVIEKTSTYDRKYEISWIMQFMSKSF